MAQIQAVSERLHVVVAEEREKLLAEVADAEVIYGWIGPELLKEAPRLRWVMVGSAGVEWALSPEMLASPVILINSAGVFDRPIADHIFAFILAFSRRLYLFWHQQASRAWKRDAQTEELTGKTLGIVGLGSIGQEVARLGKAFGMRVLATRRHPQRQSEEVDRLYGPESLLEVLPQSDYVAITAALTGETRGMIGEREIQAMKPGAVVINIARGAIIDEMALIHALQEGHLGGAGLDVFVEEPLPPESPLWRMKNVIITPHMAGLSQLIEQRKMDLLCENLRRDLRGEPLLNIVDKELGY